MYDQSFKLMTVLSSMSCDVKCTSTASVLDYLDKRIHSGKTLEILFPQSQVCLNNTSLS